MLFDGAFAILLISGLLRGYRRGFLGQVVFVGGVVVGIMFAGNLVNAFGKNVEEYLKRVPVDLRPATLHLGAVVAIALVVWIVGGLVFSRNRQRFFGASGPSPIDKLAGSLLGLGTAAIVVCLLVAGVERLPKEIRTNDVVAGQLEQSMGVKWAQKAPVAPWVLDIPEVKVALGHAQTVIEKVKPGGSSGKDQLENAVQEILR